MLGNIVMIFMAFWFVMLLISFDTKEAMGMIIANFFGLLFTIIVSAGIMGMEFPGITTVYQEVGLSIPFMILSLYHAVMIIYGFISYRHEEQVGSWMP